MSDTVTNSPNLPDMDPRIGQLLKDNHKSTIINYCTEKSVRVLTILFGDQEGSTEQGSETTNNQGFHNREKLRKIYQGVLKPNNGLHIEYAGDAFLAVFSSPSDAVTCALYLQQAYRNDSNCFRVRIGLHDGEIVFRENAGLLEVYGREVNLCSRIAGLGQGGQILLSWSVFEKARTNIAPKDVPSLTEVRWRNWGAYHFKGVLFNKEQEAYDVCEVGENGCISENPPAGNNIGWPVAQQKEQQGWRPAKGKSVPGTNWQLVERLGAIITDNKKKEGFEGQFGEVWKVYSQNSKDYQAFKFCFSFEGANALKRELRLLKELGKHHHPNLVSVYDAKDVVVKEDGIDLPLRYLEMEYVPGPSLEEWLKSKPSLQEKLEIIAQVADALDTVHAAGIYHRDIKPTNILLTTRQDGMLMAKLTDFGLGAAEDKEVLASLYKSKTEGIAGTWGYMAPEVLDGGQASSQSDLYSLGMTLYQVLIGDITRFPIGPWEREMPTEVATEYVRKSTSTALPRWENAAEMANALRNHDKEIERLRMEQESQRQKVRKRRTDTVVWISTLVAAVLFVFLLQTFKAQQRAERMAYDTTVYSLAKDSSVDAAFEIPQTRLDDLPKELRNWEWAYLKQHRSRLLRSFHTNAPIQHFDFSPDGSLILAASEDSVVKVWNIETGEEVCKVKQPQGDASMIPCWAGISEDNKNILSLSSSGNLHLWDVSSGEEKQTSIFPRPARAPISMSNNMSCVVYNMYINNIHSMVLLNMNTGDEVEILTQNSYKPEPDIEPNTSPFGIGLAEHTIDGIRLQSLYGNLLTYGSSSIEGIYDIKNNKKNYENELQAPICAPHFSFNALGNICLRILSCIDHNYQQSTVKVLSFNDRGEIIHERILDFSGFLKGISFFTFDPSDESLHPRYIVGDDNSAYVLRLLDSDLVLTESTNHPAPVRPKTVLPPRIDADRGTRWQDASFLADSNKIVLVSAEGDLSLWTPEESGVIERLSGTNAEELIVHPSRAVVATKSAANLFLWDCGKELLTVENLPIPPRAENFCISSDKHYISWMDNNIFYLYNLSNGRIKLAPDVSAIIGEFYDILSFYYGKDRLTLLGNINLGNIKDSAALEAKMVDVYGEQIACADFPNVIFAELSDSEIEMFGHASLGIVSLPLTGTQPDRASQAFCLLLEKHWGYEMVGDLSRDGKWAAVGIKNQLITIYDLKRAIEHLQQVSTKRFAWEWYDKISSIALSPSDESLLLGGDLGNIIASRTSNLPETYFDLSGHINKLGVSSPIRSLDFSRDGNYFIGVLGNNIFYEHEASGTIKTKTEPSCATFSPDNARIVGCLPEENRVAVWNTFSGNELLSINCNSPEQCFFTPDGLGLVTISRNPIQVLIWKVASWN